MLQRGDPGSWQPQQTSAHTSPLCLHHDKSHESKKNPQGHQPCNMSVSCWPTCALEHSNPSCESSQPTENASHGQCGVRGRALCLLCAAVGALCTHRGYIQISGSHICERAHHQPFARPAPVRHAVQPQPSGRPPRVLQTDLSGPIAAFSHHRCCCCGGCTSSVQVPVPSCLSVMHDQNPGGRKRPSTYTAYEHLHTKFQTQACKSMARIDFTATAFSSFSPGPGAASASLYTHMILENAHRTLRDQGTTRERSDAAA